MVVLLAGVRQAYGSSLMCGLVSATACFNSLMCCLVSAMACFRFVVEWVRGVVLSSSLLEASIKALVSL